jgi:hypothetical protein
MANRRNDPFEKMFELIDDVLGKIEELPSDEVSRFLADVGNDTDAVKRKLYERASQIRGEYWARNVDPPAHVQDFLAQLRPTDLPSADPAIAAASARKRIGQLLGRPVGPRSELAFAFRDKQGEITPEDAALLEELAARLKEDADDEKT